VRGIAWALAICFVAIAVLRWQYAFTFPHRFFRRNYRVSDCGSVALTEDSLNLDRDSDSSDLEPD
jgi:hypothetical protein